MRTRVTLQRAGGTPVDIVVTTDAGASVGDVADAIARAEPGPGGGPLTLRVTPPEGGEARTLARAANLAEAGLRAGSFVAVSRGSDRFVEPGLDPRLAFARLQVVTGPSAGLVVDLPQGVATIGRGEVNDVRLNDQMVSKLHARVVVGETIRIVDAGSSNGLVIGGGRFDQAVLGPSDYVMVGESVLRVERLRPPDGTGAGGAVVEFNRSPRVVETQEPRTIDAPAAPEPLNPGRFPTIALIAPLLMGVVLMLFWRNPMTLVFIALSPVIMVGTYVDKRYTDRKRLTTQTADFRDGIERLTAELDRAQVEERRIRLGEMPSTAEAVAAATGLQAMLWSRRPEHDEFLRVRVGVGAAPSRTTLRLPPRGNVVAALWAELEQLEQRFATVPDVPLVVDLREVGAVGVAGADAEARDIGRALVAQLACLHSPAELVITGVASDASSPQWDWLKWMPHVASPHSPLAGPHLASSPAAAIAVVMQRLEELVDVRTSAGRKGAVPAVVLVVENDAQVDRGRLVRLAEEGPAAGVHVVWCAPTVEDLPAVCRAFVAVDAADGGTRIGLVRDGVWESAASERLDAESAARLGRRMAAVVDVGAPVIDQSDLPRSVGYLTLSGPEIAVEPQAVVERWHETGSLLDRSGGPLTRRRQDAGLRAVVGVGAGGEFVLDLRSQGPHALVGGTTGAGKSEFLQSWVLGLAAAHSPDRISFLFVDYKGGAAFADCVDLPHSVGLVTDLSPHLVRRALTSLRAELRFREHLLNRKKAKDLLALERVGDPETPPALVIVVDEFAALASEVPEFVDGVVDVAQRGRSLGLHLILATQRPAGVIKDNLRANTPLRVALRMADEHDSVDVLGSPVAAAFDPGVPGRGAVRTGPGRIAMFQTGFVGARSTEVAPKSVVGLESLVYGPGEPWDVPVDADLGERADDSSPTDIARVVRTIGAAARQQSVPAPRRPWLPELDAVIDLARLGDSADGSYVLGVADIPSRQEHRVLSYSPDVDGSMVVLGTSGSGKSTVLRTIAVSATATRGGPAHVYGLDFGAGGLAMLDQLPHVGSVVDGSDIERTSRLVRRLRDDLDERAARFAAVHAGNLPEYRRLADRPQEPRIILLLDGLSAFREAYEADSGRTQVWSAFQRIVAEGRPLGIHAVMAGERPGALPTSLAGSVTRRLVLRQADENAYGVLDVPKDVLGPQSTPGRGVFAGDTDDFQVAVPGGRTSPAEQAAQIGRIAGRMAAAGVSAAPPVRRLPSQIELASLPASVGGQPVLGVADDTLEPIGFAPHGTLVLAGLPGSGRSTVLDSLTSALRRWGPGLRMYYLGNRRSPLHASPSWTGAAIDAESAAALVTGLLPDLARLAEPDAPIVLVVETLTDFLGGPAEQALTQAFKAARQNDHLVLAESETSTWGSSWPLVAEIRNGRRGLVLQPDHLDGESLFRTPFPRMARAEFPPGRGVWVEGGKLRRVQVAFRG